MLNPYGALLTKSQHHAKHADKANAISIIINAFAIVYVMQTSNILKLLYILSLVSGNPFYMKTAISTVRRRVEMFETTLIIQYKL